MQAKATQRQVATLEADLAHHRARDRAFQNFRNQVDEAMRSGLAHSEVQQAQHELDTALQVARRHHELALQHIQTTQKFSDEA